jgi:hypothetical protein
VHITVHRIHHPMLLVVWLRAHQRRLAASNDEAQPKPRAHTFPYLGVAAVTAYILWPRRKWRFHFRPARLQLLYLDGPRPAVGTSLKRDIALHLDAHLQHNAPKIDQLSWALVASIALLLLGTASLV